MLKFLRSLLSFGFAYNAFIYIIGKLGTAKLLIFAKYLPYTPGMKILDLGCGPGTNTKIFQENDYLGIDISENYIKKARHQHPSYKFIRGTFLALDESLNESFDVILMSGLIHHLSDETATNFINKSHALLKRGGKLLAIENCIHSKQSRLKKKFILMDRGEYVRELSHLRKIIEGSKMNGSILIEENLLLVPYTHAIITLKKD